jgi:N-methylhydantoinase B
VTARKRPAPEGLRRNAARRARTPALAGPVLTEIVRNGVLAVTEEMKSNLMRTAYNMIIYEGLDFTVGLYTAEGDTVSIGMGLPLFIRGMAQTVRAMIERFGPDALQPGDILVTNDSYITGSHLNHFTFALPIFHGRRLCAFACCMAHWRDVGGVLGGNTTDIYAEGLQIPIMKYQEAGVVNRDLADLIRMNVRIPALAMGDLRAQVTALKTGERRFLELLDRYGRAPVLAAIANIMNHSEQAARARTRSIPDGLYEAQSFMDDDGIELGKRVPIRVRVLVEDDRMTIDLSQVSAQVRGAFNAAATTGTGCAQLAYKCLTSPTDYPINEGSFRALKVVMNPGTIVSAVRPAAMRNWMSYPMTVADTILKAMEQAIPKRTIAGHFADLMVASFSGMSPRDGRFFMGNTGPMGGGWGAKHGEDGMSATVCLNDGDTHITPCEQVEAKYPLLFERHALRDDSGGAGRHRGGLGTEQVIQARSLITVNLRIERVHCRPWGLAGGLAGMGNEAELRIDGICSGPLPSGKVAQRQLKRGDAFVYRAGGGGGFGPPHEREPARVANDVRQDYVSRTAARESYGVAVREDGTVDQAETERLRNAMAAVSEPRAAA